jgi:small conductance mechanosensitive channel
MDREATEGTAQELSAVELKKRMDTLDGLGGNVLQFFIVIIAGLMILRTFDLDIGPAIAGIGVVGVAVGFGAQHLVRDYLNGALILIENQFSKGDVVRLAGVSGTVEDFSLRRTTIRDLDGVVHTVPNGEIAIASNLTRVWARINQDVTLAYGTDIDQATDVVDAVGKAMAADPTWKRRILEAPKVDRVAALGEYGITLKILGTVRAPDQWAAAGELRTRLLAAFREHGIEIPRPQRVVLAREPGGIPAAEEALGGTLDGD